MNASDQTEVLWLTAMKLQKGLNTSADQMHRQYGSSVLWGTVNYLHYSELHSLYCEGIVKMKTLTLTV